MIDKLETTGKSLYGLYPMAVHPDDFQPWFRVNGHWLCFSIFDMYSLPMVPEWEFLQVMAFEYDEQTADEVLSIAKWYCEHR